MMMKKTMMKKVTGLALALLLSLTALAGAEEALPNISGFAEADGRPLTLVYMTAKGENLSDQDLAVLENLSRLFPDALSCRTEEGEDEARTLIVAGEERVCFSQAGPLAREADLEWVVRRLMGGADQAFLYIVLVRDQNGEGAPGVYLNLCTDESCQLLTTDENGVAALAADAPCNYHVQLLRAPEGYQAQPGMEAYTGLDSGWTVMELEKI